MRWVFAATLPGIATMSYFFGLGVLSNVLLAATLGLRLKQPCYECANDQYE
ncbi:hypothetical protein HSBAA_28500 [Vreelandella sulfidaeris]|uniref:Uncharacterized protein n=1 Tax=Vreelandella sulfidaeris TaxID=115553 RepID=A0A455UEI5_9GAMM|nr:hypothetical protein HSBAA_28500 [Halomonas sulfidaeris]